MRRVLPALLLLVPACGGGSTSPETVARAMALENEGIGRLERYDYAGAVAPLRECVDLVPDWDQARLHLAIALIHAGKEDPLEARRLLDEALAATPDEPHVLFLAGFLADEAGDQDRALPLLRKAYQLTRDPFVGARLGSILSSLDQDDEALKVLLEVNEAHPALIAPVNTLQLLYRRLGDDERADVFLARLMALKGRAHPEIDSSTVGSEMQLAYGNMGPYSMCVRSYRGPGAAAKRPSLEVTAGVREIPGWTAGALPAGAPYLGVAALDFDADGDVDLFVCGGDGPSALLRNDGGLAFTDVAAAAGVAVTGAYTAAAGEMDVGNAPRGRSEERIVMRPDLVVMTGTGLRLLRNRGDGTFEDATPQSGLSADPGGGRALLVVDADHEGDLDLFVAGAQGQGNRLWANRGPGVFEEIGESAGVRGDGGAYGPAVPIDVDGDLDLDLLVTRPDAPAAVFMNDRLMTFHLSQDPALTGLPAPCGALGGDFDRDGFEDVVLAGDGGASLLEAGRGGFAVRALPGSAGGPVVDVDARLSGLRDLVFAAGVRLPAQDGAEPFAARQQLFEGSSGDNLLAADLDGAGAEEIVLVRAGSPVRVVSLATKGLGNPLVLDLEGVIRNDISAGWSNLEGRGALVEVRWGPHWVQRRVGSSAGFGASPPARQVFGIGPAAKADFVRLLWPDGVQQGVLDVPVGAVNRIVEQQLRPDSCPLLFSWDGERFVFVTDFVGAGGVGFMVAPGVFGGADPTESVKVEGVQARPNADGEVVFRLVEAMEETCYLDRADLLVVDHPADVAVHPDEQFTGEEPFPSGEILAHRREILPVAARDEHGTDVLDRVLHVDRRYPDATRWHPRLTGATAGSTVELDFGDGLADVEPGAPLVLYLNGWIEYPYTRTTVAAAGEGFEFAMPTLEAWDPGGAEGAGAWRTLVANMGFPAGFPRVMTCDVTGKVSRETPRLRIRTSYEVYWDRIWLGPTIDAAVATRQTVLAPSKAELRWLGYPREFSPDGRHPRIYDYHTLDQTMPWKTVEGDFTRFGDVLPLLGDADDMYVIHGKGEEIDLRFDARGLPALPDGWTRSYVLRFVGWCKGQELYTADGFTVEPLPFLGMKSYPYAPGESYPDDEAHRRYRAEWNTRRVRRADAAAGTHRERRAMDSAR